MEAEINAQLKRNMGVSSNQLNYIHKKNLIKKKSHA